MCFRSDNIAKRDQWELITNNGFCMSQSGFLMLGSPCGKAISYPDFGCMKRDDGCWSCKEKPYMILDLEKKIWTVKMDEYIVFFICNSQNSRSNDKRRRESSI